MFAARPGRYRTSRIGSLPLGRGLYRDDRGAPTSRSLGVDGVMAAVDRVHLIDWLSRKQVSRYYQKYVETQWYSSEQMIGLQVAKLRRLLQHCRRSVPFYREILSRQRVDVDRMTGLEVLEAFPIIDKQTVRDNYRHFRSEER